MNSVPFVFIDDVCHQLKRQTFKQISELSNPWSTFGAEHGKRRREFLFACTVDGKECCYAIEDRNSRTGMLGADLNLKFDRITMVGFPFMDQVRNQITVDKLKRDVLPNVSSFVANCNWCYFSSEFSARNRMLFEAFKNCPGFVDICVQEQGQESREFVTRQVEIGNVERLNISANQLAEWPEPEKLAETLEIFANSSRFHCLINHGALPNDTELFELFLERALAKELKRYACISLDAITSANSQVIGSFRAECRDYSAKEQKAIAWRIPDSSRRIVLTKTWKALLMEVA